MCLKYIKKTPEYEASNVLTRRADSQRMRSFVGVPNSVIMLYNTSLISESYFYLKYIIR
jgi:hypothetical protein